MPPCLTRNQCCASSLCIQPCLNIKQPGIYRILITEFPLRRTYSAFRLKNRSAFPIALKSPFRRTFSAALTPSRFCREGFYHAARLSVGKLRIQSASLKPASHGKEVLRTYASSTVYLIITQKRMFCQEKTTNISENLSFGFHTFFGMPLVFSDRIWYNNTAIAIRR